MTSPKTSTAMFTANGSGIDWGTKNANTFVSSVIFNTLGRRPATQFDLKRFYLLKSQRLKWQKMEFFLKIIGSQEYTQRYDYLYKVHHVYFNPSYKQNSQNTLPCNCYYYADNNQNAGLMPSMQYIGVALPPYKFNASVARALVEMCWAFDRRSCDLYDCGKAALSNYHDSSGTESHSMDCRQWPGSEELVDLKTGESECGCINGKVWNIDKTECVSENSGLPSSEEIRNAFRDFQLSQTNCSRWPGSQPIWDEPNNKAVCGCTGNMVWNSDNSACIDSKQAALKNLNCSQYPGTIPSYDNNGNLGCACPDGGPWIQNLNKCASQQDIAMANADCSPFPGTVPVWDVQNNRPACDCPSGTEWSQGMGKCINKQEPVNNKTPTRCQGHTIYCKWNTSGIGKYHIQIKKNSAIDINKDGICDLCGFSTKGIHFISKSAGCKDHNWDPN